MSTTNDQDPAVEARHAAMRDLVMTWDEITDELIWDAYDPNGPEHQDVAQDRLEQFCKRFPHFADRLRRWVEMWNTREQLTIEALEAIEAPPELQEQEKKGLRFAQWCMRFYERLKRVEQERDELLASALNQERAREILRASIKESGALYNPGEFLAWDPGDKNAVLDGQFSAEYLEAVAWWMKHQNKPKGEMK